jgi:hypothetical protein
MQLYPHWLDGEFVRIASNVKEPEQVVREMIRALKLHALLGTQFVLNDVQIFDSAAVIELFADNDALDFLRNDRTFLNLRVVPDPDLGNHSFALAARGFTRAVAKGWKSSVFFDDPTPIKQLAEEIINDVQDHGGIDLDAPSKAVQANILYSKQLVAARRAVDYFADPISSQQMALPSQLTNYYEVLRNLREKLKVSIDDKLHEVPKPYRTESQKQMKEDLTRINGTISFIDKWVNPSEMKARSSVLAILDNEPNYTKRQWIWNNVVQAWNCSVQQTVCREGGSVGVLPGAVSPAPYLETPTDVLVPVEYNKQTVPLASITDPPTLPIDIDKITWKQIAEVRKETVGTMKQLMTAREIGHTEIEYLSQTLRKHLDAVVRILPPSVLPPPGKMSRVPTYVLQAVGIAGLPAVVAVLGNPAYIPLACIAGSLTGAYTSQIWMDTGQWRQRRALTNTLSQAATGQPK